MGDMTTLWCGSKTVVHRQSVAEAGARRFATTLGGSLALSLLAEHAQWALDLEGDIRARAAARCFAASPIDMIVDVDREESESLAN